MKFKKLTGDEALLDSICKQNNDEKIENQGIDDVIVDVKTWYIQSTDTQPGGATKPRRSRCFQLPT
ncbi:unnamed protein product [Coffea canephora]|uniref:Uncharacterized protein n=1 Tax=Coffea canephora TaxID=49390 RepID=A0A068TXG6_COFCA|nr:unnamed protein product [Coffea canephora]